MNKEEFLIETQKLHINITNDMLNKLEKYYHLLLRSLRLPTLRLSNIRQSWWFASQWIS